MAKSTRTTIGRLLLECAALIVPSCGGGGGSPAQDLFIDDFDSGLGAWTVVSPSVAVNPTGIGRGPSMHLAAQGGVPAEAQANGTFSTGGGLTISLDVVAGSSIAEIQVVDNTAPAVRDTYAIISDNSVHFSIQGQTLRVDFTPDSYTHKFLFHAESGVGQWQRDGIIWFKAAFSPTTVFLTCRDLDSGSDVDLVHISTP